MKKITVLFTLLLTVCSVRAQTIFDFDTNAVDNGDNITETIDGITVTLSGDPDLELFPVDGFGGSTGDAALTFNTNAPTSLTFTFDQPVVINSILPLDGDGGNVVYTFTPTGGTNSEVMASLVGGEAPGLTAVNLNWVGVTSFTVTASSAAMGFDDLSVYAINNPTIFDFDTNSVDNGDNVSETIDGITVTLSGDPDLELFPVDGFGGSTGDAALTFNTNAPASLTFTFDQPVVINSILPLDGDGGNVVYTFTPTGGTNSEVMASLVGGEAPGLTAVNLNWVGVTSFTVTASSAAMGFDDLSVYAFASLAIMDDYMFKNTKVYPNPVEHILYIKNISDLKSINMYNNLGQLVLQSKKETIDVSNLSKGLYFLQIHTDHGTETKRIIKK